MIIALGSIKHAPGVSTTALALAGTWPAGPDVFLVEADPSGGDAILRYGLAESPGLLTLAAAVRHAARETDIKDLLRRHAQVVHGDLPVIAAPVTADQAQAALDILAAHSVPLSMVRGTGDPVVIVDCGRLDPDSRGIPLAAEADLLLLVVRGRLPELLRTATRLDALRAALGDSRVPEIRFVQIGGQDYSPGEVAQVLGIRAAGLITNNPQGARALTEVWARHGPLGRHKLAYLLTGEAGEITLGLASPERASAKTVAADSLQGRNGEASRLGALLLQKKTEPEQPEQEGRAS